MAVPRREFAMMTGDLTALEEHLERFRAAERDDVSDCAVCETGAMAEYLLALGRRTEAVALVEDLLQKKEFCEEQPWKFLSILTDDALDRNDLQEAERFFCRHGDPAHQNCRGPAPGRHPAADEGILRRLEGRIEAAEKEPALDGKFLGPGAAVLLLCGGSQLLSGPQRAAHRGQSPPCSRLHRLPRKRPV